jgi:hypothetical protein
MINEGEECDTNRETLPEVPQVYNVVFRIRLCSESITVARSCTQLSRK